MIGAENMMLIWCKMVEIMILFVEAKEVSQSSVGPTSGICDTY